MSMRRVNPKRDGNEKAIVDALLTVGAVVLRLSGKGCPDLLVSYKGRWTPLEVKVKQGKLTEAQAVTYALAAFPVVRTINEALMAIGAL